VLIVDTDFVNPSVAERLEIERTQVGLGDLLSGAVSAEAALTPTGIANLDLIDAFSVGEHAGDLLRSDRLRLVLTDLYAHYDLIILDSPPTLSTADSRLVASQADAAVVVYDPSVSRIDELSRAIELLRSARVNLIGLVANRSQASHPVYMSAKYR
jgi:non-specific protein-tyrosine kinase